MANSIDPSLLDRLVNEQWSAEDRKEARRL